MEEVLAKGQTCEWRSRCSGCLGVWVTKIELRCMQRPSAASQLALQNRVLPNIDPSHCTLPADSSLHVTARDNGHPYSQILAI